MSIIRIELINAALNKADALIDYNIFNSPTKVHDFKQQTILSDEFLTNDEKLEATRILNINFDHDKILYGEGTKRICENCREECLATNYCEYCVRNYLRYNFLNWTSGNDDIDFLIQRCQMETLSPGGIVEWIPCNRLRNVKYLTRGGFSDIYTADWIDGNYDRWNTKEQQLERLGTIKVVIKKIENNEHIKSERSWLDEVKSHLTISNRKYANILRCYGVTRDPSDGQYMLIMHQIDVDLGRYLQQNHYKLTWKDRIYIIYDIVYALFCIHKENSVHRDLHSGNILFNQIEQKFFIGNLGFCGPVDKPLKNIEGDLPFIAPEVIAGKEYTFSSDIYSIGMLMWEISSGQPPFMSFERGNDLAIKVIDGMRPKVIPETPLEYQNLMKQCWDADPTKRPQIYTLKDRLQEMRLHYQYKDVGQLFSNQESKESSSSNNIQLQINDDSFDSSKVHQFKNLPEPRNATEALHSRAYYKFNIPDNNFNDNNDGDTNSIKGSSEPSNLFRKLQQNNSNYDTRSSNNTKEITQQQTKRHDFNIDDEGELYNNPNLHSDMQDKLEIPDGK